MEDWSIDKIIEDYLAETSQPLVPHQRKKYLEKANEAKAQWMQRRASWWELELYFTVTMVPTNANVHAGEPFQLSISDHGINLMLDK